MQHPTTRARQHLLLQEFTGYTAEAAVAMLMSGESSLDDPNHVFYIELTPLSSKFTERLATAQRQTALGQTLMAAGETCRQQEESCVFCSVLQATVLEKLDPSAVQDVRMRIEAAIALGKEPPTEKLEAFSDAAIEREAAKRKKSLGTEDGARRDIAG